MHDRVLRAAGVLVYRRPGIDQRPIDRPVLLMRGEIAEPVPAGVDERVHRVRLAPGRAATARARRVQERLVVVQWIGAAALVIDRLRQQDGQVLVAHRDDAVRRAVDDREGRAPVALPADQPVAQSIGDLGLRGPRCGQPGDDGRSALVGEHAVEVATVDQALVRGMGDIGARHRVVGPGSRSGNDPADRQPEALREGVVTVVMGGHGHDRARAVAGQHVVGDEDRDALAIDRVDRLGAEGHAGLLAIGREAIDLRPPAGLLDIRVHLRAAFRGGQGRDQGMLRGEDHECRPEERVRSSREHAQRFAAGMVVCRGGQEVDLRSLGAPDPVGLLDSDRLRPVDALERQQLVRIGGRLQVPLLQVPFLHQRSAPPAVTIHALHLLAREGAVVGAPVDRRLLAVRQALLQEAQEQPLVPAVVGGVSGDDLVVPAERCAHGPELATHLLDVLHRPGKRVAAVLDRRILRRQPEGIEADRKEDVEPVHPSKAGQRVRGGHDVPVADVQVARRVRVHRHEVVPRPRIVGQIRVVQAQGGPLVLPARLDGGGVVPFDPAAAVGGLGHGPTLRLCSGHRRRRFTPRRRRGVRVGGVRVSGGATGTRTPDPLHAMQVLFQLSYSPTEGGL